ncbi:hypothetical protein NM688_g2838 [Phlebia brevispora]|uniref:Uncharacterized protein n=1 Tax=Phlebia brevispora TaxID=194682 RepID=A0ACC1T856_9APHY|nr:hypothetical protein NM688_g2838 [Phlebia brevispora]
MMSAHAGRDNNDIDSGHVLYDEALENITLKFLEFELLRDIEEQQASGLEQARLAGMQESRFQADIPPGTGQFPGDIPAPYPGNSSSSSQSASMVPHASSAHIYDCSHLFDLPIKQANPLTIFCLFMVVVINIIGGASRPLCNFILQCCIRILTLSFRGAHRGEYPLSPLSQFEERLLKEFPRDLRHVRRIFRLEPMVTTYAACPKCSFVYPPSTNDVPNSSQYPTTCSWHYPRRNKEKTCGQTLVELGAGRPFSIDKPIRPFTFRHMTDFVSHMLSRPDIEGHLERAWDRVQSSDTLTDMWHSPIILEVMQSHRRQITTHSDDNSLFLIWGGVTMLGRTKLSVGMMAQICCKVSPEIRCLTWQDISLRGILSGPQIHRMEEMNLFLAPLVDDLLEMWHPRVYSFSTTTSKQHRMVFSILGSLISNIPASRVFDHHFSQLLTHFGPAQGWWTFPFERSMEILHRVQTNMEPAWLQSTMMNTFCMAGDRLGFLSTSSCPLTLSDGLKLMDDYLVQFRGVDHELYLASTSSSLSPQAQRNESQIKRLEQDAYEILMSQLPPGSLVSPQAISMRRVAVNGLQYTTAQESRRDSQVFFLSSDGDFVPGFIREIFLHTHHIPGQERAPSTGPSRSRQISETFAVIHRYPVVPGALDNPYARYPDFDAFICQAPNRSSIDVIPVQRIMCHAGLHRTREGRYVLKALSRFISSEAAA